MKTKPNPHFTVSCVIFPVKEATLVSTWQQNEMNLKNLHTAFTKWEYSHLHSPLTQESVQCETQ